MRGYSSVVEHSTADREVPGSIPGAPSFFFPFFPESNAFVSFLVLEPFIPGRASRVRQGTSWTEGVLGSPSSLVQSTGRGH